MSEPLLEVRNLKKYFPVQHGMFSSGKGFVHAEKRIFHRRGQRFPLFENGISIRRNHRTKRSGCKVRQETGKHTFPFSTKHGADERMTLQHLLRALSKTFRPADCNMALRPQSMNPLENLNDRFSIEQI